MSLSESERRALVAGLERVGAVDGWRFEDLYPGCLSFSKGRIPAGDDGSHFSAITVACEPDANESGKVTIQVTTGDGRELGLDADVPYVRPLTVAGLVEIVRPFLKRADKRLPSVTGRARRRRA